jgi:hypothetical protein
MQGVFVPRAIEKFWRLFRAHPAVLLALALLIALPDVSKAQTNYNRIALQRWYAGNTSATFAVGSYPYGLAFDGTSVWVASWNSTGSLTKINASDGTTTTVNLGTNITQLAFDGSNIWAVEDINNSVAKVRASDGVLLGNFPIANVPYGVAFDGTNVWVTNLYGGTVTKLRKDTGAVLGTFTVGSEPLSMACDGANMWVANMGSNSVT